MKMLHVTITTAVFEKELEFYESIVGLTVRSDLRPGRNMVFLSDNAGDTEIEIIGNTESGDVTAKNLSVGFSTKNLEELRRELMEKGYAATPVINPNPHTRFFFIKDPAGMTVQFMQENAE